MPPKYLENLSPKQIVDTIKTVAEKPNIIDAELKRVVEIVQEQVGLMAESIKTIDPNAPLGVFFAIKSWMSAEVAAEVKRVLQITDEQLADMAA